MCYCRNTCEGPAPATHWRPLVSVIIDAVRKLGQLFAHVTATQYANRQKCVSSAAILSVQFLSVGKCARQSTVVIIKRRLYGYQSHLRSTTLLDCSYLNNLKSSQTNTACAHPLTVSPADRLRRKSNSFSASLSPASNPRDFKLVVKSSIFIKHLNRGSLKLQG